MIAIKVTLDPKLKQLVTTYRREGGGKLRVFGALTPRVQHMQTLGEYGVSLMKQRASKGIGSDDTPMGPLTDRYRKFKQRKTGRSARDLKFTGKMLDSLSLRSVSATQARIDITSRDGRMKARANEQRTPWFGWSPQDMRKLGTLFCQMFGGQIANFGARIFGQRTGPIWMDPNGTTTNLRRSA